jgi:hypothetical protein
MSGVPVSPCPGTPMIDNFPGVVLELYEAALQGARRTPGRNG